MMSGWISSGAPLSGLRPVPATLLLSGIAEPGVRFHNRSLSVPPRPATRGVDSGKSGPEHRSADAENAPGALSTDAPPLGQERLALGRAPALDQPPGKGLPVRRWEPGQGARDSADDVERCGVGIHPELGNASPEYALRMNSRRVHPAIPRYPR